MDQKEKEDETLEEMDSLPDDVLLEMMRSEKPPDSSKRLKVFVYSLSLFLLAGILGWDAEYLVILAFAILIHELGHIASMKLLGYTNLSILFIPLLGGGATGRTKVADSKKEAIVSLSGPFVGLGASILILLFSFAPTQMDWAENFALFSLALNYLNLLPFFPLDGGRFLNTVFFSKNHRMEFSFKLITSCLLLVIAVATRELWLAFFILLIVLTIPTTRREGKIVEELRARHEWGTDELTVEQVGVIKDAILAHERNPYLEKDMNLMAKKIEGIWKRIGQRPMSRKSRVLLLSAYVLLWIVPLILFFLIIVLTTIFR